MCDDSPSIRRLLAAIIGQTPGIVLVGEAHDGDHVLDVVAEHDPDVLIIDFEMPGRNGAEAIGELRRRGFAGRAYVFTGASGGDVPAQALQAGADAVLPKETVGELMRAVLSDG